MPSKNKHIIKKNSDNWYRKNKEKQIKRQLERRKELKDWLTEYKCTLNCKKCGCSFENNPEWCDFHHIDSNDKNGKIATLVNYSKKKVFEEIKKCTPLCANCHRTEHYNLINNDGMALSSNG